MPEIDISELVQTVVRQVLERIDPSAAPWPRAPGGRNPIAAANWKMNLPKGDVPFQGSPDAARALVEGCMNVVRETPGLVRFGGGARIPGYANWKEKTGGTPEAYCQEVIDGKIFDPVLGPFLKFGTVFDCVVADYIPDPQSLNFGASVIWEKEKG